MSINVINALMGDTIYSLTGQELNELDCLGYGSISAAELKDLISTKCGIPLDDFRLCLDETPLSLFRDHICYKEFDMPAQDVMVQLLMRPISEIQRGWWHRVEVGLSLAEATIPLEVRGDKDIVLSAVSNRGQDLQYSSLNDDFDIVLAAVRCHGYALQFANPVLRDDYAVVLSAVTRTGMALQFASKRLRANRQVVRKAVNDAGVNALKFACRGLQIELTRHASSMHSTWWFDCID